MHRFIRDLYIYCAQGVYPLNHKLISTTILLATLSLLELSSVVLSQSTVLVIVTAPPLRGDIERVVCRVMLLFH